MFGGHLRNWLASAGNSSYLGPKSYSYDKVRQLDRNQNRQSVTLGDLDQRLQSVIMTWPLSPKLNNMGDSPQGEKIVFSTCPDLENVSRVGED